MTELKQGDRVRVTYEATYERRADGGAHWLSAEGRSPLAPPGATIEVIKPEVKEPKAPGSVVEVAGRRIVLVDDDDAPWKVAGGRAIDGEWYFTWTDILALGEVTVLFDPDVHTSAEPVEAHPSLRDDEGDVWHWQDGHSGPGYYCRPGYWTADDAPVFRHSREAVDEAYGPVTEI